MAVRYIGDPEHVHPSGGFATFRFFNSEIHLFAVVHNSHLHSFSVDQTLTGASRFDITLRCEPNDDFSGIPEAPVVEMFVRTSTPPTNQTTRLLSGIIDYFETDFERDTTGKRLLRLQGRSVWGHLIDTPARGRVQGKASDVFRALSTGLAAVADQEELTTTLDASFNCPSAYGAMRLLSLSLDCVVQNHHDSLIVDTVSGARARLKEKPPIKLGDDQLLSVNLRRGSPVRKRNVDDSSNSVLRRAIGSQPNRPLNTDGGADTPRLAETPRKGGG